MIHRTYLAPKGVDERQMHNLFRTRGTVISKIVNIIIDNGSIDNLVSKKVVGCLNLKPIPHDKPYQIGWIQEGEGPK